MDHNLSQVPKKSNTPDTEGHNGRTCQTGNELAENFRRVNGLFIHGNRSHTSQVLQPPVGQSTGPVATEAVTSVGTSLGSLRASTLSPSVIRAENQDLPPLNVKKRAAESSTLPRKRRRDSYSTSQLPGHPQLAEWATMHLTTQLLQSRYEEIIVRKEMETDAVPDFDSPPTQPEEKCRKCAAADEERLYD
ncbi:hypothetical protein EN45_042950 [Penicillium chrysogenum]|uniref:Uncharacterized protein n=1 Tax=Penicillium chrysogenum TaxID=5076 RepID=A0A161ZNA2_PENCH|nr:hypothetical protein EN45_042950 [Penicillium chrysogenum]